MLVGNGGCGDSLSLERGVFVARSFDVRSLHHNLWLVEEVVSVWALAKGLCEGFLETEGKVQGY